MGKSNPQGLRPFRWDEQTTDFNNISNLLATKIKMNGENGSPFRRPQVGLRVLDGDPLRKMEHTRVDIREKI